MERWCPGGMPVPKSLAGLDVEIDTASLTTNNAISEREWRVVGGPALNAMKEFAPGYREYWFCEHMLEMD